VAGQVKEFLTGEPLGGEMILDHKTRTAVLTSFRVVHGR
jgi:hypothetical protein